MKAQRRVQQEGQQFRSLVNSLETYIASLHTDKLLDRFPRDFYGANEERTSQFADLNLGVERSEEKTCWFTYPLGTKFNKTLFEIDTTTREAKVVVNNMFKFYNQSTV
eukprot:CAMPEP_0185588738 /NCGR_PEP_ID=MMETSP0434-20130131/54288_1 /TAXON_ID=626734 ORGANISM="Favella taraikaensis, Strain Fe Narragansett Bay" /NCGR_SAMPLE_ID=MMETSP0434 /ASSEMBLY_ACC=CAM_ASM_000379 /LENGTH=107 /DNA_ID=CAMNT_0028211627 /DNA_START=376 /DNA_END=699 /DNA_ORIENTATION=+